MIETISWKITQAMVVLEYQQVFREQGISSAFKLGMNYGMCLSSMVRTAE